MSLSSIERRDMRAPSPYLEGDESNLPGVVSPRGAMLIERASHPDFLLGSEAELTLAEEARFREIVEDMRLAADVAAAAMVTEARRKRRAEKSTTDVQ